MQPIMMHYWHCAPDGNIHVQNAVGGMLGQHHVHSPKGFEKWKALTSPSALRELKQTQGLCKCGLKPGQVRDHNGRVSTNNVFEKGKD